MELSPIVQLITIVGTVVGAVLKLEKRLSRIETKLNKLDRCPHVEEGSPLVHPAAVR